MGMLPLFARICSTLRMNRKTDSFTSSPAWNSSPSSAGSYSQAKRLRCNIAAKVFLDRGFAGGGLETDAIFPRLGKTIRLITVPFVTTLSAYG